MSLLHHPAFIAYIVIFIPIWIIYSFISFVDDTDTDISTILILVFWPISLVWLILTILMHPIVSLFRR